MSALLRLRASAARSLLMLRVLEAEIEATVEVCGDEVLAREDLSRVLAMETAIQDAARLLFDDRHGKALLWLQAEIQEMAENTELPAWAEAALKETT